MLQHCREEGGEDTPPLRKGTREEEEEGERKEGRHVRTCELMDL